MSAKKNLFGEGRNWLSKEGSEGKGVAPLIMPSVKERSYSLPANEGGARAEHRKPDSRHKLHQLCERGREGEQREHPFSLSLATSLNIAASFRSRSKSHSNI